MVLKFGTGFTLEIGRGSLFLSVARIGELWASLPAREWVWSPWREVRKTA